MSDTGTSERFDGAVLAIPEELRGEMRGRSWRPDARCPGFDELALLRMGHWGFDGQVHRGELVVAAFVAQNVLAAFARIFDAGFPIHTMARIDRYGADDATSMKANNSSAFCFRRAWTGPLSEHALGLAVDINPVQNPMVLNGRVYPDAGREFLDRGRVRPGMIVRPGPVVAAFEAIGWTWGGDFTALHDYHHFQRRGLDSSL